MNNNAPFTSCLSKISSTLISNAEDLDIDSYVDVQSGRVQCKLFCDIKNFL